MAEYEVRITTGDKFGAGTDANISVNIFGELGESGLIELKDSLLKNPPTGKANKFERANCDVFLLKEVPYLGAILKKLHIRTDASGAGSDWLLNHVEIVDYKTNETWFFKCNDWLGTGRDKTVFKDLPALRESEKNRILSRKGSMIAGNATLEENANMITYNIDIKTGTKFGAGTDANVYMILYGTEQTTDQLWMKNSLTHKNDKFENGNVDRFEHKLMDVGDIKKIRLGHDDSGPGPAWYVDHVEVEAPRLGRKWKFPVNAWFDKSKGDRKIERDFYPQDVETEDFVPRKFCLAFNAVVSNCRFVSCRCPL